MKAMLGLALVFGMGCATDPSAPAPPPGAAAEAAYLEIQFTDTSVALPDGMDAQLWVTVGRIEIQDASGTWTSIAADPMRFDLFAVEHGDASVVASSMLPRGGYRALALEIDAAQLVVQGTATPITIVGGTLELPLGPDSDLAGADARALVLDFDATKSLQTITGPGAPATTTAPPTLPTPANIVLTPAITVASFAEM